MFFLLFLYIGIKIFEQSFCHKKEEFKTILKNATRHVSLMDMAMSEWWGVVGGGGADDKLGRIFYTEDNTIG
jgi:hypothetical protein